MAPCTLLQAAALLLLASAAACAPDSCLVGQEGCRKCSWMNKCSACMGGWRLHRARGTCSWVPPHVPLFEYVLVSGVNPNSSIQVLALDTRSGQVTPMAASGAAGGAPSFLAWHRGAPLTHLVAVNTLRNKAGTGVSLFRWQLATGGHRPGRPGLWPRRGLPLANLSAVAGGFSEVGDSNFVSVSPSGRWALTSSLSKGTVYVVPIQRRPGGPQLGAALPPLPMDQIGKGAHQAAFDPTGRFVYVPVRNGGYVRIFALDDATGTLHAVPNGGPATVPANETNLAWLPPGSGPRHIAFHPRRPIAYVVCEFSSTVVQLDWSAATGRLWADFTAEPWRVVSIVAPGSPPAYYAGAELAISGDGRFLYASSRANVTGASSISIFSIHPRTGALAPLAFEAGGGDVNFPRHFSLSTGDRFALVANEKGDSITVLARDAATGLLRKVQTLSTAGVVPSPSWVGVVPPPGARG